MYDEIDEKIMRLLNDNARMSNSAIARRLQISEATVRQRLKRLVQKSGLKFTAQIDPKSFPETFIVVVGITTHALPEPCIDQVRALPNQLFTFTVTGRYDMIAAFAVNSRQKLSDIIEKGLHAIEGVSHTETFVVLKNFGLSLSAENYCELLEIEENTPQPKE